ncbi:O-antigen ligase family protein [Thiofilum flexile]|uniref:O-antigen ligase family protein n=1 Tax=Thiofilum flexile TaxID=125627 RepID=UPI00037A5937|nr:O-antigen ligase family protein [Thiofilum flexile]
MLANKSQWVMTIIIGLLFIIIPILYSGRTLQSLFLLEIAALLLLLITGWNLSWRSHINKLSLVLFGLILITPLLYLIPLPYDTWIQLPGRERYLASLEWLTQKAHIEPYLAISIIPYKAVHAFLAMIPLVAITLALTTLNSKQRYYLVVLFLIVACFQAILALMQYMNPNAELLKWVGADTGRSSQGTYRNRDHLATFMVIALPMAIGLTIYSIGLKTSTDNGRKTQEWRITTTLTYLSLLLIILIGAIFTRSRAGVLLTIVALIVTLPTFAPHMGGRKAAGIIASILGLGSALLASIGLIPVLNRFIVASPSEDGRWEMFAMTMKAIKEFFPIGSGPSTFQEIYRGFQPVEQLKFINHAHNDYLELILEIGALGIVLLALAFIVYIMGWVAMWGTQWDRERIIKVAAGIGILLFMLHAILEFTSHTPANAMFLAFLAGLFLKLPSDSQLSKT